MNIWIIVLAVYLAIGVFFGVFFWSLVSRKANSKKNDAAEPEPPQEPAGAPQAEAGQPAPKGFKAAYNKTYNEGSEATKRFVLNSAGGRFLGSIVIVLLWPIYAPILLPVILKRNSGK